jgi:hypothetical protein
MSMFFAWTLSITLTSVFLPMPPVLAKHCLACYPKNCQACLGCASMVGDEAAAGRMECESTTASTVHGLAADAPPFVVAAVVKCSECMGKCSTAYYNCKSQCAPNDRACLMQCQELSSQCQQNCKDVLQCE